MENREFAFVAMVVVMLGCVIGIAVPGCMESQRQAIIECVKAGHAPLECEKVFPQ